MHNLLSHNQLAGWKESFRRLNKTLDQSMEEADIINDYYDCLIECDDDWEVSVTTKQLLTIITLLSYAPVIFVSYMVTNAFIVSGVIRHWNDVNSSVVTGTQPKQVSQCIGNHICKEKVRSMSQSFGDEWFKA